jgi:hypothetical protein
MKCGLYLDGFFDSVINEHVDHDDDVVASSCATRDLTEHTLRPVADDSKRRFQAARQITGKTNGEE